MKCQPADSGHAVRCCHRLDLDAKVPGERSVCTLEVAGDDADRWNIGNLPLEPGHDGTNATHTLASAECAARGPGFRLCFRGELNNKRKQKCDTGCGHDERYVWSATPCDPRAALAASAQHDTAAPSSAAEVDSDASSKFEAQSAAVGAGRGNGLSVPVIVGSGLILVLACAAAVLGVVWIRRNASKRRSAAAMASFHVVVGATSQDRHARAAARA